MDVVVELVSPRSDVAVASAAASPPAATDNCRETSSGNEPWSRWVDAFVRLVLLVAHGPCFRLPDWCNLDRLNHLTCLDLFDDDPERPNTLEQADEARQCAIQESAHPIPDGTMPAIASMRVVVARKRPLGMDIPTERAQLEIDLRTWAAVTQRPTCTRNDCHRCKYRLRCWLRQHEHPQASVLQWSIRDASVHGYVHATVTLPHRQLSPETLNKPWLSDVVVVRS